MSLPKREEYIFYKGDKFQVEFYFTGKGLLPVKEHLDLVDNQVKIKLLALVKYIAEHGRLFDETKFRLIHKNEKIYEFKPKNERFFNFFAQGNKIIITNAYTKKSQKVDVRELAVAIRLKKDYEFRLQQGVYYETN